MPGYSGTPLARKLGITDGMRLLVRDAPRGYRGWLDGLPATARIVTRATHPLAAVHLFVSRRGPLARELRALRRALAPTGFVWVSWPKRSSNVTTDVTEDVIRAVALPLGFVDVKVCAVTDIWSGLKLVIRKDQRALSPRAASARTTPRRPPGSASAGSRT